MFSGVFLWVIHIVYCLHSAKITIILVLKTSGKIIREAINRSYEGFIIAGLKSRPNATGHSLINGIRREGVNDEKHERLHGFRQHLR